MAKYKQLYNAAALTAEYEKLVAWQALTKTQKKAAYATAKKTTPRIVVPKETGYIRVFGSTSGLVVIQKKVPNFGAAVTAAQVLLTAISSIVGLRAPITIPTDSGVNIITDVKKYKFARISLHQVIGVNTNAASRVLSVPYTKIITSSLSTPFGRLTTAPTESYATVVAAFKANSEYNTFVTATTPSGTNASNSIKIYPEAQIA